MNKNIFKIFSTAALVILSLFFLLIGIQKIRKGIYIANKTVVIPEKDINLYKDVSLLKPSPLASLQDNIKKILLINEFGIDRIQISFLKMGKQTEAGGEKISGSEEQEVGVDNIGQYKDLTIKVRGDIFEQIYILKLLNKKFQSFLLIRSFKGDKKDLTLDARVYGGI